MDHLRSKRIMRRAKTATTEGQPRGQIIDAVSIRERPAEIENRAVPGHWEGNLLSGGKNSHIATLVERQTRYVMLVHIAGKDTVSVVDALVRQVGLFATEACGFVDLGSRNGARSPEAIHHRHRRQRLFP